MEVKKDPTIVVGYPLDYEISAETEIKTEINQQKAVPRILNFAIKTFKRKNENGQDSTFLDISYEEVGEETHATNVEIPQTDITLENNKPWFADYGQFSRRKELQATKKDRVLLPEEEIELEHLNKLLHHEKLIALGGISIGIVAVTAKVMLGNRKK